jgi:hypothetical protein
VGEKRGKERKRTDVPLQCAMWCLTSYMSGPRQVFIRIHDWAMVLLSATSAVHGDSSRMLLWSDLFKSSVHLDDVELNAQVPVGPISRSCNTDGGCHCPTHLAYFTSVCSPGGQCKAQPDWTHGRAQHLAPLQGEALPRRGSCTPLLCSLPRPWLTCAQLQA